MLMIAAPSTWPDWLIAIGTISAVVVAVGLQIWIAWRERRSVPELSLVKDHLWHFDNLGWPALRLAVRNAAGKHAAHDVQVSLDRVSEANGARFFDVPNTQLKWVNGWTRPAMTIPAGAVRYVQIGDFIDFVLPEENEHPSFSIASEPVGVFRLIMSPCVLEVSVTASNCDARRWRVTVTFGTQTGDRKKPLDPTLELVRL